MSFISELISRVPLYGCKNQCARTDTVFLPISEVCDSTVSPYNTSTQSTSMYITCLMSHILCLISYVLFLMSYVLCLMSYVLFLMSYVLCNMYYALCIMSYVVCLMSYVFCLCLMYYVLCIMYYVFCLLFYFVCIMSYVLCNKIWAFAPACIIILLESSCLMRVNLSCIQATENTCFF